MHNSLNDQGTDKYLSGLGGFCFACRKYKFSRGVTV
jgi:hypothetical protein